MSKAKKNQYFLGDCEEGYLVMYGDILTPREAEVIAIFYDENLAKEYLIYVLGQATPVDKVPIMDADQTNNEEDGEQEDDNVFDLVEQFNHIHFNERRKAPTLKEVLNNQSDDEDDEWGS